jgi:hypothetical protein
MSGVVDFRKVAEKDAVKAIRIFIERSGTPEPEGYNEEHYALYLDGKDYDRTNGVAPFEVWHTDQEDMNRPEENLQGWFGIWAMHYSIRKPEGPIYYRLCSQMVRIPLFVYDQLAGKWAELDQDENGKFSLGDFDSEIDDKIRDEIRRHYDLMAPAFKAIKGKLAKDLTKYFEESVAPLPKKDTFLKAIETSKMSLDDILLVANGGFAEFAVVAAEQMGND